MVFKRLLKDSGSSMRLDPWTSSGICHLYKYEFGNPKGHSITTFVHVTFKKISVILINNSVHVRSVYGWSKSCPRRANIQFKLINK